jgi:HEAT repeat protein
MHCLLIFALITATDVVAQDDNAAVSKIIAGIRRGDAETRRNSLAALAAYVGENPSESRLVAVLIDELASAEIDRHEAASAILVVIASQHPETIKHAVPMLETSLKIVGGSTKCNIIRALGYLGPDANDAVRSLREIMKAQNCVHCEFFRLHAAGAVARIAKGDDEAMTVLVGALSDRDPLTRWLAADCLAFAGRRAATSVKKLEQAMNDDDPTVRVMASRAVWRIAGNVEAPLRVLTRAIGEQDFPAHTMPVYASAVELTHRQIAISTIGEMGGRAVAAIPDLIAGSRDRNPVIRLTAVDAIGKVGRPEKNVESALRASTKDEEAIVQEAAQRALDQINSRKDALRK